MRQLLKNPHSKNLSGGGRHSTSVPSRKSKEAAGSACVMKLRELSVLQRLKPRPQAGIAAVGCELRSTLRGITELEVVGAGYAVKSAFL
jgi:hypothetical protein